MIVLYLLAVVLVFILLLILISFAIWIANKFLIKSEKDRDDYERRKELEEDKDNYEK